MNVSKKQSDILSSNSRKSINTPTDSKRESKFYKLNSNKGDLISEKSRKSKLNNMDYSPMKRFSQINQNKLSKKEIEKREAAVSAEAKRLIKQTQKIHTMNLKVRDHSLNKSEQNVEGQNEIDNNIVTYKTNEPIPIRSNLAIELEDPANEYMRPEIQKIMHLTGEINNSCVDFYNLNLIRESIQEEISDLKKQDHTKANFKIKTSTYTSYLKGLSQLIERYDSKQEKVEEDLNRSQSPLDKTERSIRVPSRDNKFSQKTQRIMDKIHSPTPNIKAKPINSPKNMVDIKRTEELLESFYNNLGHDYYTKILKIFEKYCYYGKVNTNFEMDFSQFTTFMAQNDMYDKSLDKSYCELIFNKIKGQNKCKLYL